MQNTGSGCGGRALNGQGTYNPQGSGGWALNSGQGISFSKGSGGGTNNSGQSTSSYSPGGSAVWASNSYSASGGWANKTGKSTSSSHQQKNLINWDGLVEDGFKKEIGQMAEDLKGTMRNNEMNGQLYKGLSS